MLVESRRLGHSLRMRVEFRPDPCFLPPFLPSPPLLHVPQARIWKLPFDASTPCCAAELMRPFYRKETEVGRGKGLLSSHNLLVVKMGYLVRWSYMRILVLLLGT